MPEPPRAPRPRRRKSLLVAFLLWFFLGIVAAHKLYLGRRREAVVLLLAYFFVPLAVVVAAIVGMRAFGLELVPAPAEPKAIETFLLSGRFLAVVGMAFAVLAAIWIWDFTVLLRQVREHNARVEKESARPPDAAGQG